MDTFRKAYLDSCEELRIEPCSTLLEKLSLRTHSRPGSPVADGERRVRVYPDTLDLRGTNLSPKAVTALAAALRDDIVFTRVILADTFLGDDGAILLAGALKNNTTVTELDLRGNNIRNDGAVALSQMLKVNSTLRTLKLEWNCIGIWDSGVKAIADALGVNNQLEELDLRNNKIGSSGAQVLAQCLRHNHGLLRLDLRWNNAGVGGGRALSETLKWNSILRDIDLDGNEIPEDLLRSIDAALARNRAAHTSQVNQQLRDTHLSATIQALTRQHQETLAGLQTRLQSTDGQVSEMSRKLNRASEEITASQNGYRVLEAKYERVLKEKQLAEELVLRERQSFDERTRELQGVVDRERERRQRLEEEQREALAALTKRNLEVEASFRDADTKNELLRRDKRALLEEVDTLKDKETRMFKQYEERLEQAQAQAERKLQAAAYQHEKELAERLQTVELRAKALEAQKTKLEDELDQQRSRHLNQKKEWDLRLVEFEQKIRAEEDGRRRELQQQVSSHAATAADADRRAAQAQERAAGASAESAQLRAEIQRYRAAELDYDRLVSERARDQERIRLMETLILKLRGEVRRYREDLENLRDDEVFKMKELESAISSVLPRAGASGAKSDGSPLHLSPLRSGAI